MKTLVLIITLWLSFITMPAFSEEQKTINLSEMLKMAQAMKSQEALINDPEAMAAMSRMAESFRKAQAEVPPVVVPTVSIEQGPV